MHRVIMLGVCALALASSTGSAQQVSPVGGGGTEVEAGATPRPSRSLLPGTQASAFTTINGNALSATNGALPDSVVRLRDARMGRIVATQRTDEAGLFTFGSVDPGTYVVELIEDRRVLAASRVVSLNANEVASVVVKLPFRPTLLSGLLSQSTSQAATITAAAAATGVLTTATTTDVSP